MNQPAPSSRFRTVGVVLALLVVGSVAAMKALQARSLATTAARLKTEVEAGPRVHTLVVGAPGDGAPAIFQGETIPINTTTLYGKIGGFVKEMRVDKGSQVRKGEVLAILESPETDRQTLALKLNYENLQRTAARLIQLGKEGIANAQDVDNAVAAARIAKEQWAAQELSQGYEKVVAPFTGMVTSRMVDPGAFIQNATTSLSSQAILSVADVSRLRVDFFLDQATAGLAKVGQQVDVSPVERPELVRTVRIARLAGALDLRTRTMLAEAELDNRDSQFLGGGYVKVAVHLGKGAGGLQIPAQALLMHGSSAFAAVVDKGRVRVQSLVLGGDSGNRVRIVKGLQDGDRVILNPSAGLKDGDAVQMAD